MMHGNKDGAFASLPGGLQTLQFRGEEIQLVIHQRVVAALRGDNASPRVQHVAVEANDGNIGSIQSEVDTGLHHHATRDGWSVWRRFRRGRAEIRKVGSEG